MLPGMGIHEISLAELDLENETFRISENLDPPAVLNSLREVGQLNPVLLLEQNARKTIVCGFRRVRAMKKLGNPGILARILPEGNCDPVRVFLMALWDNLAHRQLNPLETARFLFNLRNNFAVPDETLIKVYLPLLGLSPAENVLRSQLLLHQIHPALRQCLAEGRLTHASIDAMACMPVLAQERLAAMMQKIRLSASLQKKFLGLLEDLAADSGNELDAPLSMTEVAAIAEDSRLSPFQRGEKVFEWLYRLRNPRLSQAADRFQSELKKLNLPGPIRVRAHPYFEERGLHVEFDAPDAKAFRDLAAALQQAAQSSDFKDLFVVK
jgi:hypothetical protein